MQSFLKGDYMLINERMFEVIEQKKIKMNKLADYLQVSKSVVSTWKNRGTNPPAEYIERICEFLDISIEWLITGKEKENITTEEEKIIKAYRKADNRIKQIVKLNLEEYMEIEKSSELTNGEENNNRKNVANDK